jgi:hypothetical protein
MRNWVWESGRMAEAAVTAGDLARRITMRVRVTGVGWRRAWTQIAAWLMGARIEIQADVDEILDN